MMYKIKKLSEEKIKREDCNVVIQHIPRLIEKKNIWWTSEMLCTYEGMFIWFRNEPKEKGIFKSINLVPYEVEQEFFYKKVEEWKNEGCGYYIIV